MQRIIPSVAILLTSMLVNAFSSPAQAVDLDRRQRVIVSTLETTIKRAGKAYFDGDYDSSGVEIRKALDQVNRAVDLGSPELYDAIVLHIDRISKAHALLELEGVSLPPFRRRPRPTGMPASAESPSETSPSATVRPAGSVVLTRFTEDVAPILSSKCGRCHVNASRGGFSAASYAALMKGPPEGVVVFANDVIGSRLIETIESGDMPRGGAKVTAAELKTLKDWILQGAKFDGTDPNRPIAAAESPAPAMNAEPPAVSQPTGKETVSFSFDIAPLLVQNCVGCHIDAMQTSGGLRMDTFAQLLRGGDSGAIVTPGRGDASLLIKKLQGTAADGQRMPAGGRPPLADDAIALISKWIDEGASIDASPSQPIKTISKLAWASRASSDEISAKRAESARQALQLANASATINQRVTDHFLVIGSASDETLQIIGQLAEKQMKIAESVARPLPGKSDEDYFRGRATLFVFPRRYGYSEFAKMVEQRALPADWSAHWQFDGVDAYVSTVATESDTEETLESRLLAPVVSLAVATRGTDVPRWFAEGLGTATAMQQNAKSRVEKEKLRTLAVEAASSVENAKAFLDNRLTPEQADSFGAALANSMLDRSRRRFLDKSLRLLSAGKGFDEAFLGGFGVPPAVYIDQILQYAR